ncbi:exostosin domain-containing protein [Winogradskyella ludwigii]|uniref:exostosin domain-containing protein n=1 Tax=Winogradskyella ludwigii TaxID=2686076 RepID=UPI0015CE5B0F|nr:exostosin family protein [Winogradskyella ludwigii]
MIIYYPFNHYNPSYRSELFPLLKAFIKGDRFTDEERKTLYGVSDVDYLITDLMSNADIVILPMSWYYYTKTDQLDLANKVIIEAGKQGKIVWSINTGDFGVKTPFFNNLIVFRQGGYVSNYQKGHCGYPPFVDDYLMKNNLNTNYLNMTYGSKPVVGFCGQANSSVLNTVEEILKQYLRNLRTKIGFSYFEKQKVLSTSYLRASLLNKLENNKLIDCNFIKRKAYRAGLKKGESRTKTTNTFYKNMLESQYVLCVRGAGNFSVRFYETLMMGRIPIYVDTDGYLPLEKKIDWKKHVVWVDYNDRHRIDEILLEFHQNLNEEDLMLLFKKNRKIWKEKLTLSGFFQSAETFKCL